jgi:hypothetical protein
MPAYVELPGGVRACYDEHGAGDPLVLLHDVVTLEHTLELYRGLPGSELAVVPGTSHFLLQEPALWNTIIVDFLTTEPVPTVAPVRRAQKPER